MPGDRKHHTDKFRRCVEKVMAQGKSEDSAYAICTTSLQDAGEPIFEGAEMHELHLLGATGTVRTEMLDGREYLVVPVVALMEGVIHAVNAETPEFVPFETLQRAAETWNGRPVTLGHPMREGKQCSANHPEVIEAHGIGVIRNSRVDAATKKMLQEAWVEKSKAKKLHPEMYEKLLQNKTEEVSVGAFVVTDKLPGDYKGKQYKASWLETTGDHLAFLPGGRGACSVEMGCGTHRAAMRVCEDHMELEVLNKKDYRECPMCKGLGNTGTNPCEACDGSGELKAASVVETFLTLSDKSLDERIAAVYRAVDARWNTNNMPAIAVGASYTGVEKVFDDRVIIRKGDKNFSVPYKMKGEEITLGEPTEVKQQWVAAMTHKPEVIQLQEKVLPIEYEGGKWVIKSRDKSRRLAEHPTEVLAREHEQAIRSLLAHT